jgi:hypothetical protein
VQPDFRKVHFSFSSFIFLFLYFSFPTSCKNLKNLNLHHVILNSNFLKEKSVLFHKIIYRKKNNLKLQISN